MLHHVLFLGTAHLRSLVQGGAERIARDMNRHSAVVLQGPGKLNQEGNGNLNGADGAYETHSGHSWKERGQSGLEDLREVKAAEVEGLHIQDPRRYFERKAQSSSLLQADICLY